MRSRRETITFKHPFRIKGIDRLLPAGAYEVITDEEMLDAGIALASDEGMFAAPEGGACVAALGKLLHSGFLHARDRVVIYNTGAGLKYLEAYSTRFPRASASEQDKLGGLITPR